MSSSFEIVNYRLRPNKSIERKMMLEVFSKLSSIDSLENFKYIGFGSTYFADFVLFHKFLGINELVSIEEEENKRARFEFNLPFASVEMKYGKSTEILPSLTIDKKSIIWLDYDSKLSKFMLDDIDSFFDIAIPGSLLLISLNIEQDKKSAKDEGSEKEYRTKVLQQRIGKNNIPEEFEGVNLNTEKNSDLAYEIISRKIQSNLNVKNGSQANKYYFNQLFNFEYKDGSTMKTIGGILLDEEMLNIFDKMNLNQLPFYKNDKSIFKISCPQLTVKEVLELNKHMPHDCQLIGEKLKDKKLRKFPLNQTDIINYAKIYRYYPFFNEALV